MAAEQGSVTSVAVADRRDDAHSAGLRAGLDKRPADVAAMFDRVARRYDLTNTVLSGGIVALHRGRRT